MTWVKLDDRFPDNPKVAALSDGAAWLYVRGLCYCAAHLTDGVLSQFVLMGALRARRRYIDELIARGLWEESEGGSVIVHDYLKYNPARAKIEAQRQATTERVERHRDRNRNAPVTPLQERISNAPVTPPPSRPVPSPDQIPPVGPPAGGTPERPKRTKARKSPEVPLPDAWRPNESHAAKAKARSLDLDLEAERFRNRALAKGARYVDWDRAFHTWLLSPYAKPDGGIPPGAADHEARRLEANAAAEQRAWLREQALSGALGEKAKKATESGNFAAVEAWYEQQRKRRSTAGGGPRGPAPLRELLAAQAGAPEAARG